MTTSQAIKTAQDLLPHVELTDVIVYEAAGRRVADERGPEAETSLNLTANGGEDWLETRCRMFVKTQEADLLADAAVKYTFDEPLKIDPTGVRDFVERVGVMAVYPYLRESVFTTASRLGVTPPVMGMLRAGTFKIELDAPTAPRQDE